LSVRLITAFWFCAATAGLLAQTRMIPHVTRADGGFTTVLYLENATNTGQGYDLEAFDESGRSLARIDGALDPGETLAGDIETLFGAEAVSHLRVHHDGAAVAVSVVYAAAAGATSPAHVRASDRSARRWRLFAGDWDLVFDGVALVNLGDQPTAVRATQRDFNDRPLQTVTLPETIPPLGKALYVIGAPTGTDFTAGSIGYFEIETDQPTAITALRGTLTGSPVALLWENAALALEPREDTPAHVVETSQGAFRGFEDGGVLAFLGMPFAAPPLGELRWRPPLPPDPHAGVWDAFQFGPVCPQLDRNSGLPEGDEDCLQLNVWTPADAPDAGAQLPVLFFIHGGGNVIGSASEILGGRPIYDGRELAETTRSVVVTTQYRLGPLGYFAHAGLDGESAMGVSGNYGILDQIRALQWVQENIGFFGGDPERVMIFGESAGARNTCVLLASPLSEGLFSAALMQSGACITPAREDVYARGAELLSASGCEGEADPLACLRAKTPFELLEALPPEVGVATPSTAEKPYVDGYVLLEQPIDAIEAGRHHHVPFVVGANSDETSRDVPTSLTEGQFASILALTFGAAAVPAIQEFYSSAIFGSPWAAYVQLTTDLRFVCRTGDIARAAAASQAEPVYRYLFAESVSRGLTDYGANHGLELPFVFGGLEVGGFTPDADEQALSQAMQGYWSALAAAGDPNGGTRPLWARYDPALDNYLLLEGADIRMAEGLRTDRCAFWEGLLNGDPAAALGKLKKSAAAVFR